MLLISSIIASLAAHQTPFYRLQKRADEIDYLNAGAEHRGGGLVLQPGAKR